MVNECTVKRLAVSSRISPNSRIFGLEASSSIRRSLQAAFKRANLDGLALHDLRRCYVNKLRQRGVGVDVAMRLSDHRDIKTFMDHYREIGREELKQAVKALDVPHAPPESQEKRPPESG